MSIPSCETRCCSTAPSLRVLSLFWARWEPMATAMKKKGSQQSSPATVTKKAALVTVKKQAAKKTAPPQPQAVGVPRQVRQRKTKFAPLGRMPDGQARRRGSTVFGMKPHPLERMPKTGRVMAGPPGVGLSDCSLVYARALVNPFGEFEELPCIPSSPPAETQRWRSLTRGSFQTGSAGTGFVTYQPQNPVNNANSVNSTTSAYAGSGAYTFGVGGVTASNRATLPYAVTDFSGAGDFLEARLVASAIRIKSYTNALDVGGLMYGTRLPSGETLQGRTIANLLQNPLTVIEAVTLDHQDEWRYLIWCPGDAGDLGFFDSNVNYAIGAGGEFDSFQLGFMVQASDPAKPQLFEWEIMEFWEFSGSNSARSMPEVTRSHADPVGLARVLEGACTLPTTLTIEEAADTMAANVVEEMAHSDSAAKTVEDLLGGVGKTITSTMKMAESLAAFLAL